MNCKKSMLTILMLALLLISNAKNIQPIVEFSQSKDNNFDSKIEVIGEYLNLITDFGEKTNKGLNLPYSIISETCSWTVESLLNDKTFLERISKENSL